MVLITIVTILGNMAVVIALRRAQRMPAHYPLASLAAADLLVGTCVLPLAAARELFVFHLNSALCACWSTLDVLCCTASILSLCALGWERWCGITAPLARAKRARRARVLAILVWPVSTMVALPTAFIPSPKHYIAGEVAKACTVNTNVGYVFFSVTFSFYLPTSVMLVMYARILYSLASSPPIRAHRGRTHQNNDTSRNTNSAAPTASGMIHIPQVVSEGHTPKGRQLNLPSAPITPVPSPLRVSGSPGGIIPRQRRATRIIMTLMSLFLVCWSPFFIMLPIDSLCGCVWDSTWQWCTWLGYTNSALDPLVYAASSPSVRRALHPSLTTNTTSSGRNTDAPLCSVVRRN